MAGSASQTEVPTENGPNEAELEAVPLASLQVMRCYDFDLYLKRDGGFNLYRASRTQFGDADRQRLMANGVRQLFIHHDDKSVYRKYLLGHLQDVVTDDHVPLPRRCQVVAECTEVLARELFSGPTQPETVAAAGQVIRATTTLALETPDAVIGLGRMLRHDFYTSTHLINVSVMGLVLALRLGISDPHELQRIGMGGLLHDLGKTRIDPAILNCCKRLTDEQMAELRRHPDYGMMILMDMEGPEVSRDVLRMVHQHHERLDGSGYPVGLRGEELAPCSQICAVVDVYDAMTCTRPYRQALPMQVALDHLGQERGKRLDAEIVDAWLEAAPSLVNRQPFGLQDQPTPV